MSTADEIKKLNDLLKERVITQEEFDLQKEKLLNSSTTTSTTDWLTLFLLTFFVGVLGVHRFLCRKNRYRVSHVAYSWGIRSMVPG